MERHRIAYCKFEYRLENAHKPNISILGGGIRQTGSKIDATTF